MIIAQRDTSSIEALGVALVALDAVAASSAGSAVVDALQAVSTHGIEALLAFIAGGDSAVDAGAVLAWEADTILRV